MLPDNPRVGFVGLGELGYNVAQGLKEAGIAEIRAYDLRNRPPHTEFFRERAGRAGVELVSTMAELIARADLVVSAVTVTAAMPVAREAVPFLNSRHIYVDINSCAGPAKAEIAAVISATGARFVDAAGMAGAPIYRHKMAIWACGEGAEEFQRGMSRFGMQIRVLPGPPGAAASVKMLRSVLMKGTEALLWEMLVAAHRAGLDQEVYEAAILGMEDMPFSARTNSFITRGAIHAERRAHEMEHAAANLRSLGVEPIMTEATCRRLQWAADLDLKTYFDWTAPADYQLVMEAVAKLGSLAPARSD